MNKLIFALPIIATYLFSQGCSSMTPFPGNGTQAVDQEQFGVLVAKPDVYRGRAVKLAGRMIGVETTDRGTVVLAEWLPIPKTGEYGPSANRTDQQNRFTFLYPGAIDSEGSWKGNRFVMMGEIEGTQEVVASMTGHSQPLPFMVARCLHIWKIGDNMWWDQPDTDPGGYPYLQKTYCANADKEVS